MRLDEWQKYIDTQFLADEPAEVKTVATVPVSVASDLVASDLVFSEVDELASVQPISSEPVKRVQEVEPSPTLVPQDPNMAHNAVTNMLTVIVAPSLVPITNASGRPPRIELLTPRPEPTGNVTVNSIIDSNRAHISSETPTASSKPSLEPANRTRRRSQTVLASSTVNPPIPEGSEVSKQLFRPITDLDTDIPAFQNNLPSSHASARIITIQAPQQLELLTEIFEPEIVQSEVFKPTDLEIEVSEIAELETVKEIVGSVDKNVKTQDNVETEHYQAATSLVTEFDRDTDPILSYNPEMAAAKSVRRVTGSRAKNARNVRPDVLPSGLSASELWAQVPRHVQTLLSLERLEENEVAQFSYKRQFQEKRHELIERLLDPILSLEDTARLLNVCPTTVRRYTNKGILTHYRKEPERVARLLAAGQRQDESQSQTDKETRQRRFRLSDILTFLETQRAAIEADRLKEQQ